MGSAMGKAKPATKADSTSPTASTKQRTRDPLRPEKIVDAAAFLIARDGYSAVSIAQIGAEAGIVGSGVYRHFGSKAAVLVAIFDRVIDRLLLKQDQLLADESLDPRALLAAVIDAQLDFVVGDRAIAQVYYREILSLPDADRRRLRRKQRRYLEAWIPILHALRPELNDAEYRPVIHAGIGVVHSSLNYEPTLPLDTLRQMLSEMALHVLMNSQGVSE